MRFDDNACVLIDDKGEPIGSRIMGMDPSLCLFVSPVAGAGCLLCKFVVGNLLLFLGGWFLRFGVWFGGVWGLSWRLTFRTRCEGVEG